MKLTYLAALSLAEIERMYREKVQGYQAAYLHGRNPEIGDKGHWHLLDPQGNSIPTAPASPAPTSYRFSSELEAWAHCPSVTWDEVMKVLDELPEDISVAAHFDGAFIKRNVTEPILFVGSEWLDKEERLEPRGNSFKRAVLIASIMQQEEERR